MSKPEIDATNGVIRVDWSDWDVAAEVSRTRQHRDGRITAEVKITTTAPGVAPLLHQAQLNLTSTRSRKDLEGVLTHRYGQVKWAEVMEQLCYYVLEEIRRGEPIEEIDSEGEFDPPRYLLTPLLSLGKPTVLFGHGGTSKSFLALAVAAVVSVPMQNNPLKLEPPQEATPTLYLDYETDRDEIGWRLKCLVKGMNIPRTTIKYRRCAGILADDVAEVKKIIDANRIGLVIVDSLGLACGGELKESAPAIAMFGAIRQLRVTSLLITHTTKPQEGKHDATPYGSAYFGNYARSVWEIRKSQEPGSNIMDVGLFHSKVNSSQIMKPLGFHIAFTDDSISIKRRAVADIQAFAKRVPIRTRIVGLLRREKRWMTTTEITEELEEEDSTIRKTLERMEKANEAKRYGKAWGLLSEQPDPT